MRLLVIEDEVRTGNYLHNLGIITAESGLILIAVTSGIFVGSIRYQQRPNYFI